MDLPIPGMEDVDKPLGEILVADISTKENVTPPVSQLPMISDQLQAQAQVPIKVKRGRGRPRKNINTIQQLEATDQSRALNEINQQIIQAARRKEKRKMDANELVIPERENEISFSPEKITLNDCKPVFLSKISK